MIESWKANLYRIIDRALYLLHRMRVRRRTHAWTAKFRRFKVKGAIEGGGLVGQLSAL